MADSFNNTADRIGVLSFGNLNYPFKSTENTLVRRDTKCMWISFSDHCNF